jgi:glycosyltransferase involved in cell wall biosynthesis
MVLSASRLADQCRIEIDNVPVRYVPKPDNTADIEVIAKVCFDENIDVLYYPLAWQLPLKKISIIEEKANLKIVWYFPGAWYHLHHVLRVIPSLGIKASLPYIYQALIPRKLFVKQLLKTGIRPVITMTDYNKAMLEKCGYPAEQLFSIPPGKAPLPVVDDSELGFWDEIGEKLEGRPYFLFFGPPHIIRGVKQILKAFKRVIENNNEICLVCLFRSDKGLVVDWLKTDIEKSNYPEGRFFGVWQSVNGNDLGKFIKGSFAVLKPFLLVPSEIPLAVIEAAGYGKPVIGTGPDGTGCFIEQFGLTVSPADTKALSKAMLQLIDDKDLYSKKCQQAKKVYDAHPTWEEVANSWLECGKSVC